MISGRPSTAKPSAAIDLTDGRHQEDARCRHPPTPCSRRCPLRPRDRPSGVDDADCSIAAIVWAHSSDLPDPDPLARVGATAADRRRAVHRRPGHGGGRSVRAAAGRHGRRWPSASPSTSCMRRMPPDAGRGLQRAGACRCSRCRAHPVHRHHPLHRGCAAADDERQSWSGRCGRSAPSPARPCVPTVCARSSRELERKLGLLGGAVRRGRQPGAQCRRDARSRPGRRPSVAGGRAASCWPAACAADGSAPRRAGRGHAADARAARRPARGPRRRERTGALDRPPRRPRRRASSRLASIALEQSRTLDARAAPPALGRAGAAPGRHHGGRRAHRAAAAGGRSPGDPIRVVHGASARHARADPAATSSSSARRDSGGRMFFAERGDRSDRHF